MFATVRMVVMVITHLKSRYMSACVWCRVCGSEMVVFHVCCDDVLLNAINNNNNNNNSSNNNRRETVY